MIIERCYSEWIKKKGLQGNLKNLYKNGCVKSLMALCAMSTDFTAYLYLQEFFANF